MNKKTKIAIGIVVVALVIWAVVAGVSKNGQPQAGDTIKIGAIAPLTGWGAYWGEGYVKGVSLAVDEIRKNGGKIDVIVEDGGTDANKSATAAQKLINIDKVSALTVEFTGPSSSVSPISASNKIPLIYDALPKKFLSTNPYAFKFYFDIGRQCYVAAQYLATHGSKHIGGLSINLDFLPECQASLEQVTRETGVKTTMYPVPTDTTDFRTTLAKMRSEGVDSIVPVFYEDNAISFFKQKNDLKFNVPIFMGIGNPDGFTEKVRMAVATSSIEGVIAYDQPISDVFKAKLASTSSNLMEKDYVQAAYGYDEIMYLYGALSKCGSADADCVVKNIKADTHVGALGSPGFGEDRVFDMIPVYYKYTEGRLVEFKF